MKLTRHEVQNEEALNFPSSHNKNMVYTQKNLKISVHVHVHILGILPVCLIAWTHSQDQYAMF